jgi:uncharacterized protein (TIGR02611 family)
MESNEGNGTGGVRSIYGLMPGPVRRAIILIIGLIFLLVGAVLLVLPGPGLLVMGIGVAILSLEFAWARRLRERALGWARAARGRVRQPTPE